MSEKDTTRVVVGLSGGVDSSAPPTIIQQKGFDVIGITLKVWPQDCVSRAEDKCCGPQAVMDARSVADKLNIPYYLIDESKEFQRDVIDYFAAEYKSGRTPNPCVMCNEKLKFGNLINRAKKLGAEYVATGHYARLEKRNGRTVMLRGKDARKDQTYFLFSLGQDQLSHMMFPLGELQKKETREVARCVSLKTAEKQESQEICFVPDNDYKKFLTTAGLVNEHRGEIVNTKGHVLGYHDGIEFYTIGQRKGLGISSPKALYVIGLDPKSNQVVVGGEEMLMRTEFYIDRCNWIPFEKLEGPIDVLAAIRYNHPGASATVEPVESGKAIVRLHEPQRAITPGQACVFYQDDLVLGGGWIMRD